jgi:hypothetical protein
MKWYMPYMWMNAVDDPLVVDSGELVGLDEAELWRGQIMESWAIPVLVVEDPANDGVPDDVLQNHLGLPIFSPRLRGALNAAGIGGIQYLEIEVARPNGARVVGYSIANITERRAALDTERSDFDRFPDDYFLPERRGRIRAVRMPILRGSSLGGCDIFRLDEYPVKFFVSQRFRDQFELGKFTGMEFAEIRVV